MPGNFCGHKCRTAETQRIAQRLNAAADARDGMCPPRNQILPDRALAMDSVPVTLVAPGDRLLGARSHGGRGRRRCSPSQSDDWEYGEAVFDSGATCSVMTLAAEDHMVNTTRSARRVQGMEGTVVNGSKHGDLDFEFFSSSGRRAGRRLGVDTLPGLTHNLMSGSQLLRDHGYTSVLNEDTSMLTRTDVDTGVTDEIPIEYFPEAKCWILRFVISATPGRAKRVVDGFCEKIRAGKRWQWGSWDFATPMLQGWSEAGSFCEDLAMRAEVVHSMHQMDQIVSKPGSSFSKGGGKVEEFVFAGTDADKIRGVELHDDELIAPEAVELYEQFDTATRAVKNVLPPRERNATVYKFHCDTGHSGCGDLDGKKCLKCMALRGRMRRVYSKTDPPLPSRPGHTFAVDIFTLDTITQWGNRYLMICRDICTGWYMPLVWLEYRSDATRTFAAMVKTLRRNPLYGELGFPICSKMQLDRAGEWTESAEWQSMATETGIECVYTDPTNKKSHAHGEIAVRHLSITLKGFLLETHLPAKFSQEAAEMARLVRNCMPLKRDARAKGGDGARPADLVTNGQMGRQLCNRILHHMIPPGKPCLIFDPKVRNSQITTSKGRWVVSMGMKSDQPFFLCPWTGRLLHSKDYYVHDLAPGQNFYHFFQLEQPGPYNTGGRRKAEVPCKQDTVVVLKGLLERLGNPAPPSESEQRVVRVRGIEVPSVYTVDAGTGRTFIETHGDLLECEPEPAAADGQPVAQPAKGNSTALAQAKIKTEAGAVSVAGADVAVLQPALRVPTVQLPPSVNEAGDHHEERLRDRPESLLGEQCKIKIFSDDHDPVNGTDVGDYWGKVVHYSAGVQGDDDPLWRVLFEDGDKQDFNQLEVLHHVCNKFVTPPLWGVEDDRTYQWALEDRDSAESGDAADAGSGHLAPTPAGTAAIDDPYARVRKSGKGAKALNVHVRRKINWPEATIDSKHAGTFTVPAQTSFLRACDMLGLSENHRKLYFNWLGDLFGPRTGGRKAPRGNLGFRFLSPWGGGNRRGHHLEPGQRLPMPEGESWQQWLQAYARSAVTSKLSPADLAAVAREVQKCNERVYADWAAQCDLDQGGGVTSCSDQWPDDRTTVRGVVEDRALVLSTAAWEAAMKQKGIKYTAAQLQEMSSAKGVDIRHPKDYSEAMSRPDRDLWQAAFEKEWKSIVDLKTFSKPMRLAEIRALGIVLSQVPMKLLFELKQTPLSEYAKHKVRAVILGHRGYMRKGQHFNNVFSTSPNVTSARILQWLCMTYGWHRDAADLSTAYLWGRLQPHEQFPVELPDGKKTFDPVTGEELYVICEGACYGNPVAMRRFVSVRDGFLLTEFNNRPGWSCHKCRYDPCFFVFEYDPAEPARKPYKLRVAESDAERAEKFAPHLLADELIDAGLPSDQVNAAVAASAARFAESDYYNVRTGSAEAAAEGARTYLPCPFGANGGIIDQEDASELEQLRQRAAAVDSTVGPWAESWGSAAWRDAVRSARALPTGSAAAVAATGRVSGTRGVRTSAQWHAPVEAVQLGGLTGLAAMAERTCSEQRERLERGGDLGLLSRAAGAGKSSTRPSPSTSKNQNSKFQVPSSANKKSGKLAVRKLLILVHTDDIDLGAEDKRDGDVIMGCLDSRFKISKCNKDFMLGLTRTISPCGTYCDIAMSGFITRLYDEFKERCGKKIPLTPFPPGLFIMKAEVPDEKEGAEVIAMDFQHAVGALLWAARMCYPECQLGVSFLTRVMSCPTKEAYKAVLHMIAYLYGQRHRGIRMRGERGAQLRAHCDASNNPDRSDKCKAQGGYIIFLGDSPVCWGSKKVSHVGQSAQHNEMMQVAVCSKAVTWIRFLLEEIGFTCHIIGPTVIENDNLGAVKLCRDDILTPANCYYDKDMFFAKEAFEREITDPRWVSGDDNLADSFTKPVGLPIITRHVPFMTGYGKAADGSYAGLPPPGDALPT